MNRREMLKVSGFSLGAAALGSATQPSQSDSQTTRKHKIVITGGHRAIQSMAAAALLRGSPLSGTKSCCCI